MSGLADPERWDVFRARIPVTGGSEDHLVILVTATDVVRVSRYVHVVPIDTDYQHSKAIRTAVVLLSATGNRFLDHDSYAMCHWLLRIEKDKIRRGQYIGTLDEVDRPSIRVAIERVLSTHEE